MFSFFKKLFGRGVSLKSQQKREFVHFHKLKGGKLKTNTSIFVDSGFVAVIFHYDKLCDVLREGEHKFTEMGMPILTKYNKPRRTRNGIVVPKKIKADIYFVNLKVMENFACKISGIKTKFEGKNKKIKAYFSYDMQALNPSRLLYYLLLDMAYVKNTGAMKEVGGHTKLAIKTLLNTNSFELEKYADKDAAITELLNSYINKTLSQLGMEISNIKILQIKMPKKLQELFILQNASEKGIENKELKDFIEKSVLETKPEAIPVPAYFKEKSPEPTAANAEDSAAEPLQTIPPEKPKEPEINFEESYQKYLEELERKKQSEQPEINANVIAVEPETQVAEQAIEVKIAEAPAANNKFCNFCGENCRQWLSFATAVEKALANIKFVNLVGQKTFLMQKLVFFAKVS